MVVVCNEVVLAKLTAAESHGVKFEVSHIGCIDLARFTMNQPAFEVLDGDLYAHTKVTPLISTVDSRLGGRLFLC